MTAYVRASQVKQVLRLFAGLKLSRGSGRARAELLVGGLAKIVAASAGTSLTDQGFGAHGPSRIVDQVRFGWQNRRALKLLVNTGTAVHPLVSALQRELPAGSGAALSVLREDVVTDRDWYESSWVRHALVPVKPVDSSLMSIVRLDSGTKVHAISLYRAASASRFDAADRRLVELFHQEIVHSLSNLDIRPELSTRERQTLDLLLEGRSDKEIASRLGISHHTVNQYNKAIYRKTGVHSRSELLALWAGTRL